MSDIDTLVLSTEGDALTSGKRRNGRAAYIARIDYLGENAAASPTCDRPFSKDCVTSVRPSGPAFWPPTAPV